MLTIKCVYKDHDRVLPAAEYTLHGKRLSIYVPRIDAAYVLGGHVVNEIDLGDPSLINVFVINGIGKTVDRLSGAMPETEAA